MACEYESIELRPNRKYAATVWMYIPKGATTGHLVWNPVIGNVGYEWDLQLTA